MQRGALPRQVRSAGLVDDGIFEDPGAGGRWRWEGRTIE